MSKASLNALKAFESAARLESLTRAAEELHVTQAAVSRQVRALEEYLEVDLFKRQHRSIQLTAEGRQLFLLITAAFQDIDHAVNMVSRRYRRDTLTVRTYMTFAQRWLIRRLASFHERYPAIEVLISASTAALDFDRDHLDAAIRFSTDTDEFAGLAYDFIVGHDLVPVCSPSLLEGRPTNDAKAFLASTTLLHSLVRPQNWEAWLHSANLVSDIDPTVGLKFESSFMAYDAAMHGMGVAMGVVALVADDIRAGRLVTPFSHVYRHGSYYLVYPEPKVHSRPVVKLRDWLRETVALDTSPTLPLQGAPLTPPAK